MTIILLQHPNYYSQIPKVLTEAKKLPKKKQHKTSFTQKQLTKIGLQCILKTPKNTTYCLTFFFVFKEKGVKGILKKRCLLG